MFKTLMTLLAASLAPSFAQSSDVTRIELPGEALFPEGIAYDAATGIFYVGSASQGTILQGDLDSGEVTTLVSGGERAPFTTLGLKVDGQQRLWVAGGSGGEIYAYDVETGEEVVTLTTPVAESSFLNDLVVSAAGDVYVTDSSRPVLFKVASAAEGIESWLDFRGTAFAYTDGTNANGIAITPDDKYLLVVQMDAGRLYRIEVATKDVSEIDLGGETLSGADGLVLDGQSLYVVLQPSHEVAVVTLAQDYASGTVVTRMRDPSFQAPATAALVDESLLVVNTQFDRLQGDPELPFTVSQVPLSTLSR